MSKTKTRKCRLCKEEKTLNLFERDKRVKDGITTRCKACKSGLDSRSDVLYRSLRARAKNDGVPLEVTRKELRSLFAAFDGCCIYCGVKEENCERRHHVDHVIATSKGGRHHIGNLVLACDRCNRQKGAKPFFEFYMSKKDEIGDDNLTAVLYYISLTSGQPVKDVIVQFIFD